MAFAALLPLSSFAQGPSDILGKWATQCISSGPGQFSTSVNEFRADMTATSDVQYFSNPACSGAPTGHDLLNASYSFDGSKLVVNAAVQGHSLTMEAFITFIGDSMRVMPSKLTIDGQDQAPGAATTMKRVP
jgi:hypothetical protein